MTDHIRELLAAADEPGGYEFPSDFDYKMLEKAAMLVDDKIRTEFGESTTFEGAICNQDASFSVAILLTNYHKASAMALTVPYIRFSNFGALATIGFQELIPPKLLSGIIGFLGAGGFRYIPAEVLDAQYDGVMAGDPALPTWWVRYFDWI